MDIIDILAVDNYIIVNKDLVKLIGLEQAVLLGELAGEYRTWRKKELDDDGWFYSTVENITDNLGLSAYQQRTAINKLEQLELIETDLRDIPAKRFIKINEEQVIKTLNSKILKNLTTRDKKTLQQDIKKLNINNNNINNNKNNIKNNNKLNNIYIVEIVKYLNEKTNQNYRATTNKTRTLINARLKEGFSKEDFYNVIDKKSFEWIGTDMEKYLRPETLFGTKFEGYLNQKAKKITTNDIAKTQVYKDFLNEMKEEL